MAASIPILNPGFEADALPCAAGTGCYQYNVPSWTSTGATFKPGSTSFSAIPDGLNVLAMGGDDSPAFATQQLSATLQANTTYTLDYYVGQRRLCLFFLRGSLAVNSIALASNTGVTPAPGQFIAREIVLTTSAKPAQLGGPLVLSISTNGPGREIFDAFTLNATLSGSATPEPATWGASGLLALGMVGFLRSRRVQTRLQ